MIRERFARATLGVLMVAVVVGARTSAAHADAGADTDAGANLTVRVLTIGPGAHQFLTLGESAIWIQDEGAGHGFVYDLGALQPDSLRSLFSWLMGRLRGRASRVPIAEALQRYREQDRTVEAQELDLKPAARLALRGELESAALPANRDYAYDPFRNSGATHVRDAIDRASGGRLRAAAQLGPGGQTLRRETLAATRNWPASLIVNLGQDAASDRPLGQWDRMFIPREIQSTLRQVGRAGSWNAPPLLASEGTIFAARRDPAPRESGAGDVRWVVAGLLLGTALALGGWAARRRRSLRVVLATAIGILGLGFGLLGGALVLGWSFGNHLASGHNENVFQLAPWTLVLPLLAAGVAAGRPRATRVAFWVAAAAAGLAAGGLLIKATPWFRQDNLPLIGLFLPIWVGVSVALWALDQP